MVRALLIIPPSPQKLGTPLLGVQYIAAALLAAGCEVKVIDAAARCFSNDADWIVAEAERFRPHLVGFTLFTRWVGSAYRLAAKMRGRFPLLVAGGPHATTCPDEALQHGFDIAVIGEGEETVTRLAEVLRGVLTLDAVAGIRYRAADGGIRGAHCTAPPPEIELLALPQGSQHLFSSSWYGESDSDILPGGIITSRGCPAECIFCANFVTGRTVRFRSSRSVVDELNACHRRSGNTFFQFWDDALSADRARTLQLCEAIRRDTEFPLSWSAATRVTMIDQELLRALKQAGLCAIVFGAESGADETLRAIRKGITTEMVVRALEWAKEEGITTVCDFMLGFPQETPALLERTLRFMERIAPLVDSFSTLGVVAPLPGTRLYAENHVRYGFTDWWLKAPESFEEAPAFSDFAAFHNYYTGDPNLDFDFFRYSNEMKMLIRECLRFKAEHNLKQMGFGKGL